MNDRLHRALDGELPLDALSDTERAELASHRAWLDRLGEAFRSEAAPEDLLPRVMERIEGPRTALGEAANSTPGDGGKSTAAGRWQQILGPIRAAAGWLWNPRPISVRLRPAYAFAAAIAFALVLVLPPGSDESRAASADAEVLVQFRLDAPQASTVEVSGSFTGWQTSHDLHQTAPGTWTVVLPLEPGVHEYAFVVDGERWMPDPLAPAVDDGFGGTNSRLSLLPPGRPTS